MSDWKINLGYRIWEATRGINFADIAKSDAVSALAVPAGFAWDGRLMTREQFLAYIKTVDLSWAAKGVVVHHTATPTEAQWRQYGGWAHYSVSMSQYYHNTLGWHAGPHAYVSYEGIGIFTPFSQRGIHAGATANAGCAGLEIVGNFMTTLPTGVTLDNAVFAFAAVLWRMGKGVESMWPHRFYGSTACPGNMLYSKFGWFETLVTDQIAKIKAQEETPPPPPPPPTLEERVATLEAKVAAQDIFIAALEKQLVEHGEVLDDHETRIAALENIVKQGGEQSADMAGRITALELINTPGQ